MPAYPVTVQASFREASGNPGYTITMPASTPGGKLTLAKTTAQVGETVTLTYTPDSGYELETIFAHKTGDPSVDVPLICTSTVCDFEMPAYPVTIQASFKKTAPETPYTPPPVIIDERRASGGSGGCDAGALTSLILLGAAGVALTKASLRKRQ
jgi:hypothetical protein